MAETEQLQVSVRDNEIIVTAGDFCAVYFKPPGQPQLTLRSRTDTDDWQLVMQVRQAAVNKAREIGWIV
jgi:hypothetical protein